MTGTTTPQPIQARQYSTKGYRHGERGAYKGFVHGVFPARDYSSSRFVVFNKPFVSPPNTTPGGVLS